MATTGSAHRAVKCALNSHKAPLAARFVSVGVSCRCASDGNIDYYARPGMCIIELPPAINIPKFCRAHFILLIYPRRASARATRLHVSVRRDNTPRCNVSSRCRSRSLKRARSLSMTAPANGKFVYADRHAAMESIGHAETFDAPRERICLEAREIHRVHRCCVHYRALRNYV